MGSPVRLDFKTYRYVFNHDFVKMQDNKSFTFKINNSHLLLDIIKYWKW